MTKSEITQVIAILVTAYKPGEFPPARVELYERALAELEKEKLEAAVLRVLRTNKFPPSIAELFEAYGIVEQGRPLDTGEAYDLVSRAIRYVGSYRPMPTEGRYGLPERVQRTIAALGGWEMACLHDHEESFRARFFEVYGSLSKIDGDDRSARSVALPEGSNNRHQRPDRLLKVRIEKLG
jgi:hypothetical protein